MRNAPRQSHGGTVARFRRRGSALIYITVGFVTLCAFASFAVDLGRVHVAKSQLQQAADAAARAAADALPLSGVAGAEAAAKDAAAWNTCDGQALALNPANDLVFGVWDSAAKQFSPLTGADRAHANAIRATLGRNTAGGNAIPLMFARMVGRESVDIDARATACIAGKSSAWSIVGIQSLTMSGNAYTDSYDSSKGAYVAGLAGRLGSIASNGKITLKDSVSIKGDARAGKKFKTEKTGSAAVTGLIAPLADDLVFPSVTLPSSYRVIEESHMNNGTVHLPGGTYVIGSLDHSGSAHIIWDGPVKLYLRDSYKISGNAKIETYQNKPANRQMFFLPSCKVATWTGAHSCVGDMYAPDTDFTISGTSNLYGRIVAKTINVSGNGGLHYDEALPPVGVTGSNRSVSLVN
jgi:Flp pilus assembly protein TadG